MNIVIPKFKPNLNKVWQKVRGSFLAPYVCHEAQGPLTLQLLRKFKPNMALVMAMGLFGRPLKGAGAGWESRQALIPDPSGTSPVVTSGANSIDFVCHDYCSVMEIGHIWQVAGTVTALVMDFDKYTGPNGTGTLTDKLNGTNGTITAPTVAGQAIGNVLYKDIGDTLNIDLDKGNSVRAIVTTTTTAGSGIPFVLVIPRAETNANKTTLIKSS